MKQEQTCLSCGVELPDNFESLDRCPACGVELWEDGDGSDVIDSKIILVGVLAALVGAGIWAGIAVGTHREIGWIAWGIGALIGWGISKAGGAGMRPGMLAAALAAISIVGGRLGVTQFAIQNALDERMASSEVADELAELKADAFDYSRLQGEVTDDVLRKFLVSHDYMVMDGTQDFDKEALDIVRKDLIPKLVQIRTASGEMDFLDEERARYAASVDFWQVVRVNLGAIDVLFLMLGVGTAYKLVMGRS
jgi:hypothetical protein